MKIRFVAPKIEIKKFVWKTKQLFERKISLRSGRERPTFDYVKTSKTCRETIGVSFTNPITEIKLIHWISIAFRTNGCVRALTLKLRPQLHEVVFGICYVVYAVTSTVNQY
jgi:hypothetical protein